MAGEEAVGGWAGVEAEGWVVETEGARGEEGVRVEVKVVVVVVVDSAEALGDEGAARQELEKSAAQPSRYCCQHTPG